MTGTKTLIDLDFRKLIDLIAGLASTAAGKGEIESLRPLKTRRDLLDRLETVAEMRAVIESEQEDLNLDFSPLDEELRSLRLDRPLLDGAAFLRIAGTMRSARLLKKAYLGRETKVPHLWKIIHVLVPTPDIEERIFQCIDESGEVKDSASTRLGKLRRRFLVSRQRALNLLDQIRKKIGPEFDTTEGEVTLRNGRYVIPIRSGSKVKVPGIVHDLSKSGRTLFIEPNEAIELNNELRRLELEIYQEVRAVFIGFSNDLVPMVDVLERNISILGRIDAIRAIARFSSECNCSTPEISTEGSLRLMGARHPLLGRSGGKRIVPLDLDLATDERSLLVSGPNAGGKTVLLKTVGLLTLMTHYGIPPPLRKGSVIPMVDSIYTDIGDDQSIERDLSTFSSKVEILKEILGNAGERSMVLLDEVGSGTDPTEGKALALAVVEKLSARGSLNIFTTHYAELKGIAGEGSGVVNGSMGFDPVGIEPTYVFRKGIPGKSYGLKIAERLGLDDDVLNRARQWLPASHRALEDLIDQWEGKCADLLQRERDLERREREFSRAEAECEKKRSDLDSELATRRGEVIDDVEALIRDTRRKMEAIINTTLEGTSKRDGDKIREARRNIEKELRAVLERRNCEEDRNSEPAGEELLHRGDVVWVDSFKEEAVILDCRGKENVVKVGNLRVTLPRSYLKKVRPAGASPPGTRGGGSHEFRADILQQPDGGGSIREVDIRGMFADEVTFRIQKAIDRALLHGVDNIRFIHGKGKGVLKEKVAEVLRLESRVKSFRQGRFGEGGSGVTVAVIE